MFKKNHQKLFVTIALTIFMGLLAFTTANAATTSHSTSYSVSESVGQSVVLLVNPSVTALVLVAPLLQQEHME